MCIGIPMQVLRTRPGHALVLGRGQQREVDTALVGEVAPGDWLLVFLEGARERLSATRAAEVDATLDLIEQAMGLGGPPAGNPASDTTDPHAPADPGFALPSAWSAEDLARLTGGRT